MLMKMMVVIDGYGVDDYDGCGGNYEGGDDDGNCDEKTLSTNFVPIISVGTEDTKLNTAGLPTWPHLTRVQCGKHCHPLFKGGRVISSYSHNW